MCMGHDHSSPGIESQGHRSESKVNAQMCVLYEYLLRHPTSSDYGRSSRFPLRRHQLPASAASRAARHDQRQRRSPARVGVVTRSVWPRSSIEGSFCSEVNTKCHVTLLCSASWWCGVLAICTCNREALRSIHACWSWSAFLGTASYRSVRGSTLSGGRVGVRGRFKEHTA